jgi:predicted HicB family RNase H-like nuclease
VKKAKRGRGRPKEVEAPTKTNVILPEKVRRALKIKAATDGRSMGSIVREALESQGVR